MSETAPTDLYVLFTDNGDGSADATVQWFEDDHRFSISQSDGTAVVSYEETKNYRGAIQTREPDDEVFKALMLSDEVTHWLDSEGLDSIKKEE